MMTKQIYHIQEGPLTVIDVVQAEARYNLPPETTITQRIESGKNVVMFTWAE